VNTLKQEYSTLQYH